MNSINQLSDIKIPFLNQIIHGNNINLIKKIPDNSINLIITSPPYYQQRNYGEGIGNEKNVDEYIYNLLQIFRECVRIIKPTGNIVFNLGDKYVDGNLLLIPYKFALAVLDTKLVKLVNNITWIKTNPTPRQYKKRLVNATDRFFILLSLMIIIII